MEQLTDVTAMDGKHPIHGLGRVFSSYFPCH